MDFHWYRQNPDGTWSHKPGGGAVTNLDASNNIIYDPETCDKDYSYADYSDAIMFFQVTPINNFYTNNETQNLNNLSLLSASIFENVEIGMTMEDIESVLGNPTRPLASGLKILEYQKNDEIYKITYIQNASGKFIAIDIDVM